MLNLLLALATSAQPSPPNLVARGLDVRWVANKKIVSAYISNPTAVAAGPFSVYFDADENPVSPNNRPQVRVQMPGLAPHTVKTVRANFTHLGTTQNAQLANVTGITVRVDPKKQVAETKETDNILVTPLPSALAAKSIFGAGLQCSGFIGQDPDHNRLAQTFKPTDTMVAVGIEFAIQRESLSQTPTLICRVLRGNTLLAERNLNIAEFPPATLNQLPISGPQIGSAFMDLSSDPILLTAGTTYRFEFKCVGSDAIRVGLVTDSVQGNMIASVNFPNADVAFKIFSQN